MSCSDDSAESRGIWRVGGRSIRNEITQKIENEKFCSRSMTIWPNCFSLWRKGKWAYFSPMMISSSSLVNEDVITWSRGHDYGQNIPIKLRQHKKSIPWHLPNTRSKTCIFFVTSLYYNAVIRRISRKRYLVIASLKLFITPYTLSINEA